MSSLPACSLRVSAAGTGAKTCIENAPLGFGPDVSRLLQCAGDESASYRRPRGAPPVGTDGADDDRAAGHDLFQPGRCLVREPPGAAAVGRRELYPADRVCGGGHGHGHGCRRQLGDLPPSGAGRKAESPADRYPRVLAVRHAWAGAAGARLVVHGGDIRADGRRRDDHAAGARLHADLPGGAGVRNRARNRRIGPARPGRCEIAGPADGGLGRPQRHTGPDHDFRAVRFSAAGGAGRGFSDGYCQLHVAGCHHGHRDSP